MSQTLSTSAPDNAKAPYKHRIDQVHAMLAGGFPESALEAAKQVAATTFIPFSERFALLDSVLDWYRQEEADRTSEPLQTHYDVVLISHFGLPGGNTSANLAEIEAYREHGLRVGLLHHPVFQWGPGAPMNEQIERLIDGSQIRRIDLRETVTCDLAVVRLPTIMLHPIEYRPAITARQTVIIANQTPFKFYGPEGPRKVAWDIATVERQVSDWLGSHTWYAGGPSVHRILTDHHSAEFAELDLAFKPWNECIDIDQWRRQHRREPDGRIRIGRHSRDHAVKWPEDPADLRQCYPERDPFEIHVLGGADTPRSLIGALPENWTVHPFNTLSAKDFLGQIDVMVYFIASDGLEAFGRAPLEAMAAGVPVIMDPSFEPVFGPAAVYCEPAEVAVQAERLVSDPGAYAAQQSFAWSFLQDRFSGKTLMERLSLHGVDATARG